MEDDWKTTAKIVIIVVIFAISTLLVTGWVFGPTVTKIAATDSYEIWDLDAPFGRYWVDTSGRFIFACGNLNSEIRESYTIKYLVGDELKTVIILSTDPHLHLHLVNDTSARELKIEHWVVSDNLQIQRHWEIYNIYISNPKMIEVNQ